MISRLSAAATSAVLAVSLLSLAPASQAADPSVPPVPAPSVITEADPTAEVSPEEALDVALRVTEDEAETNDPDASMALRDLFMARGQLTGTKRTMANRLLARPTDGRRDPAGRGYRYKAARKCSKNVCLHWVKKGADKPTSKKWINKNLKVLQQVYSKTRKMGYKGPAKDGRRGGNSKIDVYLKNLATKQSKLYGYCAAESMASRKPARATSYCVLDNNFSRKKFKAAPIKSLKATAAHEFFHAVQFNYDYTEDRWLFESTATWMEEQIYDSVNDNRQYVARSQIASPLEPLNTFSSRYGNQYGNWIYWEYLSKRYGRSVVRKVWNTTAKPKVRSMKAIGKVLARKGGFRAIFGDYMAATAIPAKFWPEGASYVKYRPTTGGFAPTPITTGASLNFSVSKYAGVPFRLVPAASTSTKATVKVSGTPGTFASTVLVKYKTGAVGTYRMPISSTGSGVVVVPFSTSVSEIVVSAANTSSKTRSLSFSIKRS